MRTRDDRMNTRGADLGESPRRWPSRSLLAGCGGAGEQASKMTSFSTAESPEAKAELFSLPADQMSHIQIVHGGAGAVGAHAAADRRGGVQRLQDHAGDHAGGRAGEPHRGRAGRARDSRPADAVRRQPGLLAAALRLHQGARRLPARGQVLQARAGPLRAPRHRPGRPRAGGIDPQLRRRPTWSPAPTPFASSASPTRKRLSPSLPHAGNAAAARRWPEKWWSGCAPRANCCRPAPRSASRFRT